MFLIETSDGVVHETESAEEAAEILDRYGPEVVSMTDTTPHQCVVCSDAGCEHCPKD